MDRLLSRELFVERIAEHLDLTAEAVDGLRSGATRLDPVALLRLDEIVSLELGVELPEDVLVPGRDLDDIYRAYVLGRVAADLRTTGPRS